MKYLDVRVLDGPPAPAEIALAEIAGLSAEAVRDLGDVRLSPSARDLLKEINRLARTALALGAGG